MNNKREYQEIKDLKRAMENKEYDTFKQLFELILNDKDKVNSLKKDKTFNKKLKYFILPMYLKEKYKSFVESNGFLASELQYWNGYLKSLKTVEGKGYSTAPKEKSYRGGSNSGQCFQWWS